RPINAVSFCSGIRNGSITCDKRMGEPSNGGLRACARRTELAKMNCHKTAPLASVGPQYFSSNNSLPVSISGLQPFQWGFQFLLLVCLLTSFVALALDPSLPPGGNFDLSKWKLTLPDTKPTEI